MLTSDEAERLLGAAREAHTRGDPLLHLHVEVSRLIGAPSSWGSAANDYLQNESIGYFLGQVERVGWRLEHTGYAFVESGATTSERVLSTGAGVVNHGAVSGYFTFRRAASA
ncbi:MULTISPECIES: hypothetical protein [unclassified Microbacterium]|jgi:hypothetical protein|uniref:hypothetical protein n=1 Tax=unclassified Microbacterium TaxID=2609290 RepID=UPI0004063352|nr:MULTISPECIES: hypothetical protein [unclassified Microbacterium]PQZ54295.1 hypothetical protein CQ032_13530 [Microbacterium sp. MYb43]PQZ75379.1 hypothetical protein CQ031_14095 [Microbacterium sp. MYb40]PRB19533.1 hypothetical protein CQ040_14910 [Microbacterium sp. MYb54]PRB25779.1 hypothetical protein CQ037_14725 [Microbacterium sp. MYb50]PRB64262.1 hypothetical protein CQ021_15155 [Microbacterium sp. MYb24]